MWWLVISLAALVAVAGSEPNYQQVKPPVLVQTKPLNHKRNLNVGRHPLQSNFRYLSEPVFSDAQHSRYRNVEYYDTKMSDPANDNHKYKTNENSMKTSKSGLKTPKYVKGNEHVASDDEDLNESVGPMKMIRLFQKYKYANSEEQESNNYSSNEDQYENISGPLETHGINRCVNGNTVKFNVVKRETSDSLVEKSEQYLNSTEQKDNLRHRFKLLEILYLKDLKKRKRLLRLWMQLYGDRITNYLNLWDVSGPEDDKKTDIDISEINKVKKEMIDSMKVSFRKWIAKHSYLDQLPKRERWLLYKKYLSQNPEVDRDFLTNIFAITMKEDEDDDVLKKIWVKNFETWSKDNPNYLSFPLDKRILLFETEFPNAPISKTKLMEFIRNSSKYEHQNNINEFNPITHTDSYNISQEINAGSEWKQLFDAWILKHPHNKQLPFVTQINLFIHDPEKFGDQAHKNLKLLKQTKDSYVDLPSSKLNFLYEKSTSPEHGYHDINNNGSINNLMRNDNLVETVKHGYDMVPGNSNQFTTLNESIEKLRLPIYEDDGNITPTESNKRNTESQFDDNGTEINKQNVGIINLRNENTYDPIPVPHINKTNERNSGHLDKTILDDIDTYKDDTDDKIYNPNLLAEIELRSQFNAWLSQNPQARPYTHAKQLSIFIQDPKKPKLSKLAIETALKHGIQVDNENKTSDNIENNHINILHDNSLTTTYYKNIITERNMENFQEEPISPYNELKEPIQELLNSTILTQNHPFNENKAFVNPSAEDKVLYNKPLNLNDELKNNDEENDILTTPTPGGQRSQSPKISNGKKYPLPETDVILSQLDEKKYNSYLKSTPLLDDYIKVLINSTFTTVNDNMKEYTTPDISHEPNNIWNTQTDFNSENSANNGDFNNEVAQTKSISEGNDLIGFTEEPIQKTLEKTSYTSKIRSDNDNNPTESTLVRENIDSQNELPNTTYLEFEESSSNINEATEMITAMNDIKDYLETDKNSYPFISGSGQQQVTNGQVLSNSPSNVPPAILDKLLVTYPEDNNNNLNGAMIENIRLNHLQKNIMDAKNHLNLTHYNVELTNSSSNNDTINEEPTAKNDLSYVNNFIDLPDPIQMMSRDEDEFNMADDFSEQNEALEVYNRTLEQINPKIADNLSPSNQNNSTPSNLMQSERDPKYITTLKHNPFQFDSNLLPIQNRNSANEADPDHDINITNQIYFHKKQDHLIPEQLHERDDNIKTHDDINIKSELNRNENKNVVDTNETLANGEHLQSDDNDVTSKPLLTQTISNRTKIIGAIRGIIIQHPETGNRTVYQTWANPSEDELNNMLALTNRTNLPQYLYRRLMNSKFNKNKKKLNQNENLDNESESNRLLQSKLSNTPIDTDNKTVNQELIEIPESHGNKNGKIKYESNENENRKRPTRSVDMYEGAEAATTPPPEGDGSGSVDNMYEGGETAPTPPPEKDGSGSVDMFEGGETAPTPPPEEDGFNAATY